MLQIFGDIENPLKTTFGSYEGIMGGGLTLFLSNTIKVIAIAGGVFALINLIVSGIQFTASMGDPKQTAQAWQRIYMSFIGLAVVVASFAVAAILGKILFNDATIILSPKIYGPGTVTN